MVYFRMIRQYGTTLFRAAVIHGGPGGIGSAGGLAEGLAVHCGVLEPFQSKYSIAELIAELQEQLASYPPLVLIGHSWGAWLAALYAAEHPTQVKHLVLVGCPALKASYVPLLGKRRLERLSKDDRERCRFLTEELTRNNDPDLLRELGELCGKADNCEPISGLVEPPTDFDAEMYAKIWAEADEMRRNGTLWKRMSTLLPPVTVIHGDSDPHPAEGVIAPLKAINIPFDIHLLPKCGHTPWREVRAREDFFSLLQGMV